jgi:hypothetical protein
MLDKIYFFILFAITCVPLLLASYHDVKNRKIPIKTWLPAVYVAIPLAFILYVIQFLSGDVNIQNLDQIFACIYTIIIIAVFYIIASFTEQYIPQLKMGGADFIAITIILITSLPVNILFSVFYMKVFIIASLITISTSIIYNKIKKKSPFDYVIPLILPITVSYIGVMVGYFTMGNIIFVM